MARSARHEKGTLIEELRSRIVWITAAGLSGIVALFTMLLLLTPKGRKTSADLIRWWAGLLIRLAGVRTVIVGEEKIPVEGPTIFIANHQSVLDIPTVISLLPAGVNMFAKRSLFQIPIFGWAMRAQGFVPVVRKNRAKARRSLAPAEASLLKGRQLFIFPEGTRSRTGELGTFKTGAFRLGITTGTPIVPLTLTGAFQILPPSRRFIKRGTITMVVGEMIETKGLEQADRHQLKERALGWIEETRQSYSKPDSE